MTKKPIKEMNDEELRHEFDVQNEWLSDDSFEYTALDRGDNGQGRMNYISKLEAELVDRGLIQPQPPDPKELAEADPDFDSIKMYMEYRGYKWWEKWALGRAEFWKVDGTAADAVPFAKASEAWQEHCIQAAQSINRFEMWGI